MKKSFIVITSFFFLSSCNPKQNPTEKPSSRQPQTYQFKKQGSLTFFSAKRDSITQIDIEIAETEEQQQMGLMYRTSMLESEGMLFIFPDQEPRNFWMKNTVLSLDMIFVNSQNEIVKIQSNTEPMTEDLYPSGKPAQFVVEVNAGFTEKHHIEESDQIQWREN